MYKKSTYAQRYQIQNCILNSWFLIENFEEYYFYMLEGVV